MRRLLPILLLAAAVVAIAATPALALDARLVSVGPTFVAPVYVTGSPGDSTRLYVVERPGRIQLVRGGTSRTFLDISSQVSSDGERGLLSVAFAPDYATTRRFYVYYTMVDDPSTSADETGDIRIAEYRRSATDPDAADPSSARPLLTIDHSTYSNHDGGQLQFGPDGYLYAGTGDGGGGGDPLGNGQNTSTLLGKLLRIDPRSGSPYAIPPGNLTATSPVFDYGLRNPFRFSFDRKTGDLVIGDVGQGLREEIDFRAAGAPGGVNFGWNRCEGNIAYPPTSATSPAPCSPPSGYVGPVLDYSHDGGNCAIIGGYVVRNSSLAALNGRYLYGDLCTSRLRSVQLGNPSGDREISTDVALNPADLVSFGEDARGCVYVVSAAGNVYRVQSPTGAAPCPATSGGGSGGGGSGSGGGGSGSSGGGSGSSGGGSGSSGGGSGTGGGGTGGGGSTGGGATTGSGSTGGGSTVGRTSIVALQLGTSGRRRQPVLRQKAIRVGVKCNQACVVYAHARIAFRSKRRLKPAGTTDLVAARERKVVVVALSKALRSSLARRLRSEGTALATVSVTAKDIGGDATRGTRRVRLAGS